MPNDPNTLVPAPTDAAVAGSEPATVAPAFADLSVDSQLADLEARLVKLESNVAPAPTAEGDPDAPELGNLHSAITRLYKHIFGETF